MSKLLNSEKIINGVITPAARAVNNYYHYIILAIVGVCAAYAAFLGIKYFVVRKDEAKKEKHVKVMIKGAWAMVITILAVILVRAVINLIAVKLGAEL